MIKKTIKNDLYKRYPYHRFYRFREELIVDG